jgi:MFS family permease
VGAAIETYDAIGFGTAAALYFGGVGFPDLDPLSVTLLSFATLGIGFAARPLGGVIAGHLGDRVGRRQRTGRIPAADGYRDGADRLSAHLSDGRGYGRRSSWWSSA